MLAGPRARGLRSAIDEGALEHVLPRAADPRRGHEAAPVEDLAEVSQYLRAAADHRAIARRIRIPEPQVRGDPALVEEGGQAALVDEGLARDGGVVEQLLADCLSKLGVAR